LGLLWVFQLVFLGLIKMNSQIFFQAMGKASGKKEQQGLKGKMREN